MGTANWALSVKALVLNSEGQLLLLKRAGRSRANAGRWDLPGGKVDGGETWEAALEREVWEETGLTITGKNILGTAFRHLEGRTIIYLIAGATTSNREVMVSPEHEAFAWIDNKDIRFYDILPQFKPHIEAFLPVLSSENDLSTS